MSDYTWTIEHGIAVLRVPYQDPVSYNEPSLRMTVDNVRRNRASYATQDAYDCNLRMFTEGLDLLKAPTEGARL